MNVAGISQQLIGTLVVALPMLAVAVSCQVMQIMGSSSWQTHAHDIP